MIKEGVNPSVIAFVFSDKLIRHFGGYDRFDEDYSPRDQAEQEAAMDRMMETENMVDSFIDKIRDVYLNLKKQEYRIIESMDDFSKGFIPIKNHFRKSASNDIRHWREWGMFDSRGEQLEYIQEQPNSQIWTMYSSYREQCFINSVTPVKIV